MKLVESIVYARQRRRKWWRFLQLKRAVDRTGSARAIKTAASKVGLVWPQHHVFDDWLGLLDALLTPIDKDKLARQQALIEATRALPIDALELQAWLDLYRLCVGFGLFVVGRELRDKAIAKAVSKAHLPNASQAVLEWGLIGTIDSGAWTDAEAIISRLDDTDYESWRSAYSRWLIALLSGKGKSSFPHRPGGGSDPVDDRFESAVSGKTVALVGPVPSTEPQGANIDAHDWVVKFNYRGGSRGCDPMTQGERVDITYFNIEQAKAFAKQNFRPVFAELSYVVFIKDKARRVFGPAAGASRTLLPVNWLLLDSEFNVGPNAVYDILRFSPKKITVFNTDLMLTADRASGYRPAGMPPIDYLRSFVKTHDPILQYQFFHHAWSAGLVAGDARFSRVMGMGLVGYLQELQEVHGYSIIE